MRLLNVLADILIIALSLGLAWVSTTGAKLCWLLFAIAPWLIDRRLTWQRGTGGGEQRERAGGGKPQPG